MLQLPISREQGVGRGEVECHERISSENRGSQIYALAIIIYSMTGRASYIQKTK